MPHLTLEYTHNLNALDAAGLLPALNAALVESGQFDEFDIKSRAVRLDCFAVGTSSEPRAFVHARLALLSGRTPAIKADLSRRLLEVLQARCQPVAGLRIQLCAEILDIDRDSYAKALA
jgi:5-carboxymethyl-2-hydroxymuconate isomerase